MQTMQTEINIITEQDQALNLMLYLVLLTVKNWSSTVAKVITMAIENPNKHNNVISIERPLVD